MQYHELHHYSNGENITIALIDSGISEYQKDCVQKNVAIVEDTTVYDTNGHGTMMLSLIRGSSDLLSGISPNVAVYSYKVVAADGIIRGGALKEAIDQAHADGVDIINISLGSYLEQEDVLQALNAAWRDGIIIIASAGDYGTNDMLFPARADYVISVGAVDGSNNVWERTNLPSGCDILAPGVSILTMDFAQQAFFSSGTSQATALISGYVSLLLSYSQEKGVNLGYRDICEKLHRINSGESTYLMELVNIAQKCD